MAWTARMAVDALLFMFGLAKRFLPSKNSIRLRTALPASHGSF